MSCLEFSLPVEGGEASEILMARLDDFSFDSFWEDDGCLKAYIASEAYEREKDAIETFLQGLEQPFEVKLLPDVNWNAEWESHFEPIAVDGRCLIRAPFHASQPGFEYEVEIMPKMSFGTGHHATTCLMIREILKTPMAGLRGLDMGCGTGVLAILAVKRGAEQMDAIDVDTWAYENCQENIAANGVSDRVFPFLGDAALLEGRHYDFVLANINRNILLRDMEAYVRTLAPKGILIVSGILEQDEPVITARALDLGLQFIDREREKGWSAMRFIGK